jgi:hypothetical protein
MSRSSSYSRVGVVQTGPNASASVIQNLGGDERRTLASALDALQEALRALGGRARRAGADRNDDDRAFSMRHIAEPYRRCVAVRITLNPPCGSSSSSSAGRWALQYTGSMTGGV